MMYILSPSFSTVMHTTLVLKPANNISRLVTHFYRRRPPLTVRSPSPGSSSSGMSSSTSAGATLKNEYLVVVPDHPNSLHKRLAVREKHLENAQSHVQAGSVLFGGSILSRHPEDGEQPDMVGSAMLIKAESEEAVREWLAADIYARGGAWNVNEAKIYPFRSAIRTAI